MNHKILTLYGPILSPTVHMKKVRVISTKVIGVETSFRVKSDKKFNFRIFFFRFLKKSMVKSWVSGDFFTSTDSLDHDESPGTLTFWILTTNHGHIAKSMKNRVQKVEKIKIVENKKFKCMALDLYHRQSWPPSIRFLPSQLVRLQPFKNLAFWTPKFTKN